MKTIYFYLTAFIAPTLAHAADNQHTVEYKMENYTTVMQVLSPAGAKCHVKSDNTSWFPEQDFEVPFKFKAQAEYYYTFDCKLADGQTWHQRLEPKANHTNLIKIGAATPGTQAPAAAQLPAALAQDKKVAMTKEDFAEFLVSIKKESFEDDKLKVLNVAAKSNFFSAEQVGALVDAFEFGEGKTKALKSVAKRLVDPKNSHTILRHFEFDDDKETAEKILAAKE